MRDTCRDLGEHETSTPAACCYTAQVSRLAAGNLEGGKCSDRGSDEFSGATWGRCRQMVLQKPTVPLASFPRRLRSLLPIAAPQCGVLAEPCGKCLEPVLFMIFFFPPSRPSCQPNSTSRRKKPGDTVPPTTAYIFSGWMAAR